MIVEMTPRSLLSVVFRHRVKFMAVLAACLWLAGAYCLIATPKYQSEASLLVRFGSGQPAGGEPGTSSPAITAAQQERREIVNSQIRFLHSRDLLAAVVKIIGVNVLYPDLTADTASIEDTAMDRLDRNLGTEAGKDSDVIELWLQNPNPAVAARTLQAIIDEFQKRQSQVYQSQQLGFLQNQLEQARAQLATSRTAVENFKVATGIASLDEERSLMLRQRSDVRQKLVDQVSKQQEAEQRYTKIEDALKQLPAEIKLSDEADRFKPVDDARERLSELRTREHELSINYRDDSSPVMNLQKQIQFSEGELARLSKESVARIRTGPNPVYQMLQEDALKAAGDESAASGARKPLEAELDRLDARLAELNEKTGKLNELELQQQVDEDNFRGYLQGVEQARLNNDLNREGITSVAIVQSPTIPSQPTKPDVPLIMAVAFLIGLAAGIAVTFIAEMADEAFSTPGQIEAVLGVPVLAVFPVSRLASAGRRSG